ncbi:sulfatase [Lentisphaera profundi]|uniref:Sulfatase n=1 Tax=Lentisphaera profundi TaxID=1658616 RepID=A0ABY7VSU3_9BACT|nr:sulfatase [Lentisphaera profundi]WDE95203.1 sulfatase [Lentisphaera profundi]
MRISIKTVTYSLLLIMLTQWGVAADLSKKMNVLFIPVDDFKPLINSFGEKHIHTPNLDRLAARGVSFNNAHCQYAICGSSRVSVMSGLYIDSARVFHFSPKMRVANPGVLTLPQHFKNNGYITTGIGKTFDSRTVDGKRDELSWSIPYREYVMPYKKYGHQKGGYRNSDRTKKIAELEEKYKNNKDELKKALATQGLRPLTEKEDYPDIAYSDGQKAIVAMRMLAEFSRQDKPFFYSVGFQKPHLPFVAPKKYWDMYSREGIKLAYQQKGQGIPKHAFGVMGELHGYSLKEKLPFSDDYQREIIHGYFACVSFIDAQVGLILDKLDQLKLTESTIICLWGDHGFHLGDHGLWCKHSNFEQAVRSPLIIAAPHTKEAGESSNAPVGLIDMYPTLCDLAGIEKPKHLQGKSLVPILNDIKATVKSIEMAQYPRQINGKHVMGYTARSKRYRYTLWKALDHKKAEMDGPVIDEELYDYEKDPEETINFVKTPEYKQIKEDLRRELEAMIKVGQNRFK